MIMYFIVFYYLQSFINFNLNIPGHLIKYDSLFLDFNMRF